MMPDFSKTFEAPSEIDAAVRYTFRRLTVQQAAVLRLEVIRAVDPHVRAVEQMKAEGTSDFVINNFSAVATNATVIPLTIKHVLKHVMIGDRKIKAEDWLADPEISEELMEEAYLLASKGARMPAKELGEWLSPGTSSQPAPASATNTGVTSASASASTKPVTVTGISPIG